MIDGGLLAELPTAAVLLAAIRALRARGFRRLDAFTPRPIPGMDEALGLGRSALGWLVFPAAMAGGAAAFAVQWYCNARSYPIDVGGRPPFAIPAFVPISFEAAVLAGALAAFAGIFWVCGLPRLAHPVFSVEGFENATVDGYWLGIGSGDALFEGDDTARLLRELGAIRVVAFGAGRIGE